MGLVLWLLLFFFGACRGLHAKEAIKQSLHTHYGSPRLFTHKLRVGLDRLSFGWVNKLVSVGGTRPIALSDIWPVVTQDESSVEQYARNLTAVESLIVGSLADSPLLKSIVNRYRSKLHFSAVLKLSHTFFQFTPPMIVSRILRAADRRSSPTNSLALVSILLFNLLARTLTENQYLDHSVNTAADLRSWLMVKVVAKSLQLSPNSRRRYSVRLTIPL